MEVVDLELLRDVIEEQRRQWTVQRKMESLGLPPAFLDSALAIFIYTIDDPKIYLAVCGAMYSPQRRQVGNTASAELIACLPFIKFLDNALIQLPPRFHYTGLVYRGVPWVYRAPEPAKHDPESYFPAGNELMWYEFKSTSTSKAVMTREHFCGFYGPRTIFTVEATRGYSIAEFSYFGPHLHADQQEYEVVFRPLSRFRVKYAEKNIIDPTERGESIEAARRSGYPDTVRIVQLLQ